MARYPQPYHWLLKQLCRTEFYDELAGDLEETYDENLELHGARKARAIYRKEVLKMLRPSVVKPFRPLTHLNNQYMFSNFFKIAFRNIWRDRQHAFISIFGLATGIFASILIFQYTTFESSFDALHNSKDHQVYRAARVSRSLAGNEVLSQTVHTFYGFHPTVTDEIPEVESSVHLFPNTGVFQYGDQSFEAEKLHYTTASFFDVFSFQLKAGNKEDLDRPGSVFLSESFASTIFGNTNPLGQSLKLLNQDAELQVKGIFYDLPGNSHIQSQVLVPMNHMTDGVSFGRLTLADVTWRWLGFHTYVKVRADVNPELLDQKLNDFQFKYRNAFDERQGRRTDVELHSLPEIHFINDFRNQMEPSGDRTTILIFRSVGILVILIAWINFLNLSTARAVKRAREVGVRKAMGALKGQLAVQFLLEALLLNFLALAVATGLTLLAIPSFHQLLGVPIFEQFTEFMPFWTIYGACFLVGALLSGLYPALVLTRFQPMKVLRGNFSHSAQGMRLRKTLMLLQFVIVVVLISGITAIRSQIEHLMDYDIGMNTDQTLIVNSPPGFLRDSLYEQKIAAFAQELEQFTGVSDYSITSLVPGVFNRSGQTVNRTDRPSSESVFLYRAAVDARFQSFYDIDLLAGDAFDEKLGSEEVVIMINETASREFGFETTADAIGKMLSFPTGEELRITGVMADFYYMGAKSAVDPMVLQLDLTQTGAFLNVRVNRSDIAQTLRVMEDQYRSFFPSTPFDAVFLDQSFNEIYQSEQDFQAVLRFFTIVAILIACLGIYGLSSFLINQKLKEISIRKVLGAGIPEIIRVLTREYVWLVLIAALVSGPLAYYLIDQWLDSFLTRISLGVPIFLLPVIGLAVIILITIGWKTWSASRVNPGVTLKDE